MKKTKSFKRMICMAMVLAMALSLNLSAGAASAGSVPGDNLSGAGIQSYSLQDWLSGLIGNQGSSSGTAGQTCDVPSNVTVVSKMTSTSRTMDVSWDKAEGAKKYIVQMSVTDDFTGDELKESTVKDTRIRYFTRGIGCTSYYPAHRTYYFRVKAVSGSYESAWSEVAVSYGDMP